LIGALGDRWTHVQAVADKARGLAAVLSAEDADLLVAAAVLHDVGYAPSLNRLGFYAVDSARVLRAQGEERLLVWSPTTLVRGSRPRSAI
jgi:HD superfamily phosphodiesterase